MKLKKDAKKFYTEKKKNKTKTNNKKKKSL